MRVFALLLAAFLATTRAEYDDSFKCTVCTKVANYIIPVIREAGTDAVDSVCTQFESDAFRSGCGQIVGTGWQMIVNWVKYRKAGARDICVSLSFCENGGRNLGEEGGGEAEAGGDRDGQTGEDQFAGRRFGGGGADEGGRARGGADGSLDGGAHGSADGGARGGMGGSSDGTGHGSFDGGAHGRTSPDRGADGDLNFGHMGAGDSTLDDERTREAEREHTAELGAQPRHRRLRFRRHLRP